MVRVENFQISPTELCFPSFYLIKYYSSDIIGSHCRKYSTLRHYNHAAFDKSTQQNAHENITIEQTKLDGECHVLMHSEIK